MEREIRSWIIYWMVALAVIWFVTFILTPYMWRWEARVKAKVYREELERPMGQRL